MIGTSDSGRIIYGWNAQHVSLTGTVPSVVRRLLPSPMRPGMTSRRVTSVSMSQQLQHCWRHLLLLASASVHRTSSSPDWQNSITVYCRTRTYWRRLPDTCSVSSLHDKILSRTCYRAVAARICTKLRGVLQKLCLYYNQSAANNTLRNYAERGMLVEVIYRVTKKQLAAVHWIVPILHSYVASGQYLLQNWLQEWRINHRIVFAKRLIFIWNIKSDYERQY